MKEHSIGKAQRGLSFLCVSLLGLTGLGCPPENQLKFSGAEDGIL